MPDDATYDLPAIENPFATRYVRPGALPFLFPPGESAEGLVARLRDAGWRGQITGIHGSGKSSLLAALDVPLRAAGRKLVVVGLIDGQRRLPVDLRDDRDWSPETLVIVDGYEQLSHVSRWRLKRRVRRRGAGLLVTSHKSVGLPPLTHLAPGPDVVDALAQRLVAGRSGGPTSEEIAARFAAQRGNVRETLFDLYDLYERRRPHDR